MHFAFNPKILYNKIDIERSRENHIKLVQIILPDLSAKEKFPTIL